MSPTELAAVLEHARKRTEALLEPLDDEQLPRQISPLQSPLVWDLAHIGYFEELWLLRRGAGREPLSAAYDDLYDAFAHERAERGALPILSPEAARGYVTEVREAALELLAELAQNDFLVGMVAQHELQQVETMTQTLALAGVSGPPPQGPPQVAASGDVLVEDGPVVLGSTDSWAYDNERPEHVVDVAAFRSAGPRLVALLGSTIGNLYPEQRAWFLRTLASELDEDDLLLLGIDLVKDSDRLQAAYDDTSGVTEAFVRNALDAANRELEATFEQRRFVHEPRWESANEWMDIGLRTSHAHAVSVRRLGLELAFDEGERLRVEVSAKFRRASFEAELERAGLQVSSWWTDPADDFAVVLARPGS